MLLAACFVGCSPSEPKVQTQKTAVPVFISAVSLRDIPIFVEAIGVLQPQQQVDVRPQVSGIIHEVHFVEGQYVEKGAPLFTIEPEGYAIQLKEAQAQLLQHRAALTGTQKKKERYQELVGKQLVSKQEWEELEAQIAQQEALIHGDRAKIAAARMNLKRCTITAPIAGRAGKLMIHAGNFVSASQASPLVTLSNTQQLVVDFPLAEKDFLQLPNDAIQNGLPLEVTALSQPDKQTRAILKFIDSSLDPQTGLMRLRGELPNEQNFTAGQHVRVRAPVHLIRNACVVPQRAIKINQQGPYLFAVKEDSTVEIRQLRMGCEAGGQDVVIMGGVAPGETIVTEGHLRLAPGLTVDPKMDPSFIPPSGPNAKSEPLQGK